MRSTIAAAMLLAGLNPAAHAADLSIPKAPPSYVQGTPWPGFFILGATIGGSVTDQSFDILNAGTGTVTIGGVRAGGLVGYEIKTAAIMVRAEVDGEYDFGRGGVAACTGMPIACHLSHGGVVTERLDFGLPQAWLGGATPFASVGASQHQEFAAVDTAGSASQWLNSLVAGAGLDIPMGNVFSLGVRWDHVFPGQAIAFGTPALPVAVNNSQADIFRANVKWRLN